MRYLLLFLFITPIYLPGQELQYEAPKRTVYIDVKCDLQGNDLYDKVTQQLMDDDFIIEYRDPEIGLIKTEPKEFRGRGHMSAYSLRVKDNTIIISGNYRMSNTNAAIWGTTRRDNFQQIRNIWGQIGGKNAFIDMQRLAESFGGCLEFRR